MTTRKPTPAEVAVALRGAIPGSAPGARVFTDAARRSGISAHEFQTLAERQTQEQLDAGAAIVGDLMADPSGRSSPLLLRVLGCAPTTRAAATSPARAQTNIVPLARASRSAPQPDKVTAMTKFSGLGEFLRSVRAAANPAVGPNIDPRLIHAAGAPSTAGNEGSGADGGYVVPGELAAEIVAAVKANSIAGLCAQITAKTNNPCVPIDGEAPWAASNVFWETELAAIDQSKPAFSLVQMRLRKITALVPGSSELVDDAPAFDSWCRNIVPQKIAYKLTRAIVRGTGAGQVRGILAEPSLITVARGGSVTATAAAMWKRLYGGGRGNAVWLVNPDVDVPSTPGLPLLLHGAPVLAIEACSAAGAAGDMILCDLSQYGLASKGLQIATSMFCWFDADVTAYRFVLRVDGQGLWSEAKQPDNGSATVSPFVTVAA